MLISFFLFTACHTVYHNNFYVHGSKRKYYDELSDVIHLGEHEYAEQSLIRSWAVLMNAAWTSAYNCANTYLQTHIDAPSLPDWWTVRAALDHKQVFRGFVTLALWQDCLRREQVLCVPHDLEQSQRFKKAMLERNNRIRLFGFPDMLHKCDLCVRVLSKGDDEGQQQLILLHPSYTNTEPANTFQVIVTDGTDVRRTRCKADSCKGGLPTKMSHYCEQHKHLQSKCAILNCNEDAALNKRTCANPEHQQIELARNERGKALFQLRERLRCARQLMTTNSGSILDAEEDGDPDLDEDSDHDTQQSDQSQRIYAPTATKKIQANFTRKWTHNEQLVVCPCGVILMRETFYNAEGTASVAVRFLA
jgi:hypothetical protein